jgi:hypothetical protein
MDFRWAATGWPRIGRHSYHRTGAAIGELGELGEFGELVNW